MLPVHAVVGRLRWVVPVAVDLLLAGCPLRGAQPPGQEAERGVVCVGVLPSREVPGERLCAHRGLLCRLPLEAVNRLRVDEIFRGHRLHHCLRVRATGPRELAQVQHVGCLQERARAGTWPPLSYSHYLRPAVELVQIPRPWVRPLVLAGPGWLPTRSPLASLPASRLCAATQEVIGVRLSALPCSWLLLVGLAASLELQLARGLKRIRLSVTWPERWRGLEQGRSDLRLCLQAALVLRLLLRVELAVGGPQPRAVVALRWVRLLRHVVDDLLLLEGVLVETHYGLPWLERRG